MVRRPFGLVEAGREPGPGQRYLVERSPTHWHRGIDVSAPEGSTVRAPAAGVVAAVWPDGQVSGYGNAVVLRHPRAQQTLYAHLSAFGPRIARGASVPKGGVVGYVGTTQLPRPPMASKPHLHFEVHAAHSLAVNENNPPRLDPLPWLSAQRVSVAA
jgi:murein DD-endopeptidase MepM/ murein hydrolase activator NlpD